MEHTTKALAVFLFALAMVVGLSPGMGLTQVVAQEANALDAFVGSSDWDSPDAFVEDASEDAFVSKNAPLEVESFVSDEMVVMPDPQPEKNTVVRLDRVKRPKAKNLRQGIQLTWKSVENAREYEIFRKTQGGKLKKIGTTDKLAFVDEKKFYHAWKYRYFVRAKGYMEKDVLYETGRLSAGRTQYFVERSEKVEVSEKKGTITWTATKNVDGYQLLVANNMAMKYGKKFTVGNVTQIRTEQIPMPQGTYYIALRQYIVRGGKRFVSAYHGARKFVVE